MVFDDGLGDRQSQAGAGDSGGMCVGGAEETGESLGQFFLGHPYPSIGDDSPNSRQSMAWNIKRFSNDELRSRFVGMMVEQVRVLGLTLPDSEVRYNEETRRWEHGPLDWDEFKEVLAGRGPCNAQRLERRREAHDDGAWVREAAAAYAAKQKEMAA